MADLIEVWSAEGRRPKRMVAEAFGYPHTCWDPTDDSVPRQKQYENQHFHTELEAAESILANARAGRRYRVGNLRDAQERLASLTAKLAEAAAEETEAEEVLAALKNSDLQS